MAQVTLPSTQLGLPLGAGSRYVHRVKRTLEFDADNTVALWFCGNISLNPHVFEGARPRGFGDRPMCTKCERAYHEDVHEVVTQEARVKRAQARTTRRREQGLAQEQRIRAAEIRQWANGGS